MKLLVTATNPKVLGNNLWEIEIAPQKVRQFGDTQMAHGPRSVILLSQFNYSEERDELSFDLDAILPINIGTTNKVIAVGSTNQKRSLDQLETASEPSLGSGDREFIQLCEEQLTSEMAETAQLLLIEVRRLYSGDLKRGQRKNFSETPDNFWYVIVQNRIDQLSITVRGSVEHFAGVSSLEIKDDRGNTVFKVEKRSDIAEALKLIFHAIRKK